MGLSRMTTVESMFTTLGMAFLIALHVAGALKHHFVDGAETHAASLAAP